MMELSDYLPSNNVAALIIASLIFIVTVALVARKVISFLITVVLLFFAIASGIAIANNDLVREWMAKPSEEKSAPVVTEAPQEAPIEETLSDIKRQLLRIMEQLIETLQKDGAMEKKESEPAPDKQQSLEMIQRSPEPLGEIGYSPHSRPHQ